MQSFFRSNYIKGEWFCGLVMNSLNRHPDLNITGMDLKRNVFRVKKMGLRKIYSTTPVKLQMLTTMCIF